MIASMVSSTAIFATTNVVATLEYYKRVLGFESTWTHGQPPTFGGATFGGVTIMFNQQPEIAAKIAGHQHWIKVDDAHATYKLHKKLGAKIVSELEDKPWGTREYTVEDLNGYHLRIGGPQSATPPKSQPFPENVSVERRAPTPEEYLRVAGKAFGHRGGAEMLATTWSGVIARVQDGETVGVLRIMHDAPGWFSIWDVAVVPEWQAHRIGSTMMQEAVDMIRAASPGANIFLFTYQQGFYERLGFGTETVSMRRV